MCVAVMAWNAHPRWLLVVAANRDELHDRPAAPLHAWADGSGIVAGRDLRSGGTWLGVNGQGRCVLVTNRHAAGYPLPDRPSRGELVTALLKGADPQRIAISSHNPFNLFVGDPDGALVLTNQPADLRRALWPGVHGLSNGAYDAPWPKTVQLSSALTYWLAGPAGDVSALFPALSDMTPLAGPNARHSSVFIRDDSYGTRCSTVLAIDRQGHGIIIERSFGAQAKQTGEVAIDFASPGDFAYPCPPPRRGS